MPKIVFENTWEIEMAKTASFKAEMKELMGLIAHSMYSDREVFLRELISNGADALQKMKLAGIKDSTLYGDNQDLLIYVDLDEKQRTITIRDTGIGMSSDEVVENLGTVAKSGTKAFLKELKASDEKHKSELIGQFGVGFYSAFVVADKVTVRTKRAGSDKAYEWVSDGVEEYTIAETDKEDRGTEVIVHLKEDDSLNKFLQDWHVRQVIQNWSNHIMSPIMMKKTGEGEDGYQQVNDGTAIWTKNPSDVSKEDYQKFYQALTHDMEDALIYDHRHTQSVNTEYTSLLYIPKKAPLDIYFKDYSKKGLKLYVQRVFIMDEAEQFLPSYLRFVKGIIDCEDLPLNVSREILQTNPQTKSIKSSITKHVIKMIAKFAEEDEKGYEGFWSEFGAVMKEGAAQDFANKEMLVKLLRFEDQHGEKLSLEDYVNTMKSDQSKIYYLISDNKQTAKHSPHIEKYTQKGYRVLILTDRVDPFLMSTLREYDSKPLHNVSEADDAVKDEKLEEEVKEAQKAYKDDIERIQKVLGDKVSEVRFTSRLVTAPSSIALGKDMLTPHMHRLLKEAGQKVPDFKPILELNPSHMLIKRLLSEKKESTFSKIVNVLLDQALLSEGGAIEDPNTFIQSMNELIES